MRKVSLALVTTQMSGNQQNWTSSRSNNWRSLRLLLAVIWLWPRLTTDWLSLGHLLSPGKNTRFQCRCLSTQRSKSHESHAATTSVSSFQDRDLCTPSVKITLMDSWAWVIATPTISPKSSHALKMLANVSTQLSVVSATQSPAPPSARSTLGAGMATVSSATEHSTLSSHHVRSTLSECRREKRQSKSQPAFRTLSSWLSRIVTCTGSVPPEPCKSRTYQFLSSWVRSCLVFSRTRAPLFMQVDKISSSLWLNSTVAGRNRSRSRIWWLRICAQSTRNTSSLKSRTCWTSWPRNGTNAKVSTYPPLIFCLVLPPHSEAHSGLFSSNIMRKPQAYQNVV